MSGKDSCRDGKWRQQCIFEFGKLDETGADGAFVVDQDKVTPPTLQVDTYISHPTMKAGLIKRIHYRLNPTNAATYTLRLWQMTTANPYELNYVMLYESPALQADDTDYDRAELEIPFRLFLPGSLYYSIDWTAAPPPGVTSGFISVTGDKIE